MKSISIIKDNTITYPTGVFMKYNLYLINEYNDFINNNSIIENEKTRGWLTKHMTNKLVELKDLVEDNTGNSIEKLLNISDWEENLVHHYDVLNSTLVRYGHTPLKTIETFLRMEKLEKLNAK